MGINSENIKVTALIVGSMGIRQMYAIKDQSSEMRKVEKPKEEMEMRENLTLLSLSLVIYVTKEVTKQWIVPQREKDQMEWKMKTEMKQISLQNTLTLHCSAMKSWIQPLLVWKREKTEMSSKTYG
jgi:hypothetical protein